MTTLPVAFSINVEPDRRAIGLDRPQVAGVDRLFEMIPGLRAQLSATAGSPARLTWLLRMDPQIDKAYGAPGWFATAYARQWDECRAAGDTLGVHPHAWRWEDGWISDEGSTPWVVHCLQVGVDTFREAFGVTCEVHQFGNRFMSNALVRHLDEAGVRVDLTIEPGLAASRALDPSETVTGWIPDTQLAPYRAYRPSRDDFRVPDWSRTDGVMLVPLTPGLAVSTQYKYGRLLPTATYETLVLWTEPKRFARMLQLHLRRPDVSHLSFTIRSDIGLLPNMWARLERNVEEIGRQLAGRHRWCGALEMAELLEPALGAAAEPSLPTDVTEDRAAIWLRGDADAGYRAGAELEAFEVLAEDAGAALDHLRSLGVSEATQTQAGRPDVPFRVSAIIPVYNGRRYIEEAVTSIVSQTKLPDELVLVDDGSTDDTMAVLERLAAPFPIRIVRQARSGQSAARNRGVEVADGELLAFLDQDDTWHPEHLELLCERFLEHPMVGWAYSDFDEIDADGRSVTLSFLAEHTVVHPRRTLAACLAQDLMVIPSASVMRRSMFEVLGGFDEQLQGYEDDDLYVRAFRAGWRFAFVGQALTRFRVHAASSSANGHFAESRMHFSRKLREIVADDARLNRYYFRDFVAPRFFRASLDEYVRAVSDGDWVAADGIRAHLEHFAKLHVNHAALQWKLALIHNPRVFRMLLRINDSNPIRPRLMQDPILRLRARH